MLDKYFDSVNDHFKNEIFEVVDTCMSCTSKTYRNHFDTDLLVRCTSCDLVRLYKQPRNQTLDKFYTKSKSMEFWKDIKQNDDYRQRKKFEYFWGFLKREAITSILDYGCGTGFFLNGISYNIKKVGIDPSPTLSGLCNFPVFEKLEDLKNLKFEMITLCGVLEHLKKPRIELLKIKQHLKSGGYVGIIVPNVNSLVYQTLREKCCSVCPQHLWYFDIDTLTFFMEQLGFKLHAFDTIEAERDPIIKHLCGYKDPYIKTKSFEWNKVVNITEEMILDASLGYKICAIFKEGNNERETNTT